MAAAASAAAATLEPQSLLAAASAAPAPVRLPRLLLFDREPPAWWRRWVVMVIDEVVEAERRRSAACTIGIAVVGAGCGVKLLEQPGSIGARVTRWPLSPEDRSPALPPRPKGVTAPVEGSLPLPIRPRYWRGKQNENAGGRGVAWRGVAWRGVAWLKFPAARSRGGSRCWVVATANHLVLLSVRRRARDPGRRRHNDSTLGCDRTPLSAPRRPTIRTTGSTTSFATVPDAGLGSPGPHFGAGAERASVV